MAEIASSIGTVGRPGREAAESPARPRLAYLLGTFPALSETFVLRELEGLRRRGFDVSVCAVRRPDTPGVERSVASPELLDEVEYARPDRVLPHLIANARAALLSPVRYVRAARPFLALWRELPAGEFVRVLYHFAAGIGFLATVRRRGVQHLHCHFATGCNMALAVHLFEGTPFSFTAHASGDIYMRTVLLERKIAEAAFVVPVSEYNRRYLDSVTGYRYGAKLHRIYCGIDAGEGARLLEGAGDGVGAEPRSDGTLRIVSVGSLVSMKGHDTLIRACGLLRDREHAVSCRIIGGGPELERLRRLRDELGLEEEVDLAGPRSLRDVYAALREAQVFALLSQIGPDGYRDCLPNAIIEAMLQGLPVVSTWISAIPEIVGDGRTGLLVHERDAEGAADALERLHRDADLRARMGAEGRRTAEQRFRLDGSLDRLTELFTGG